MSRGIMQALSDIDLSTNVNPFGPSRLVEDAIRRHACVSNSYPEVDSLELRESLASMHGLEPDNYIIGAGSNEVIDMLLQAFLSPGDKVLASLPSFSQYRFLAEKQGAVMKEVPFNMDFSFDLGAFLSHAEDAKVIFLCSPNNPTGTHIPREDILQVLQESACVVVDEAYSEFSGQSVLDMVGVYENLVVLRTFSKAYGLAGLRVGYSVSGIDLAEKIRRVKNPFNVTSLAQKAALAALSDQAYLEKTVGLILSNRQFLAKGLREFFTVYPSHANFLWVDVSPFDACVFSEYLLERRIRVMPFGKLPGYGGSYLRVTVGTKKQNKRLLDASRAFISAK